MSAVTIRNVPEGTHRALKARAALHNRSTEAEIRAILEEAVRPAGRVGLGTAIMNISRDLGLTDADFEAFSEALESVRDRTPAQPIDLS